MADHRPVFNERNYKRIAFVFQQPVTTSGVKGLAYLPTLDELNNYFYEEQQAWEKAGITYSLNLNGQPWPQGFNKVPAAQKVKKVAVELKGSIELIRDLVDQYADFIFWEDVKLSVKSSSPNNPLTVTVNGAMYAR